MQAQKSTIATTTIMQSMGHFEEGTPFWVDCNDAKSLPATCENLKRLAALMPTFGHLLFGHPSMKDNKLPQRDPR
jgi:hypothetical protein